MENMTPDEERELLRRAMSIAGSRKTEKKAESARENGKKGGRPRATVQSEDTKKRLSDLAHQRKATAAADAPAQEKRPVGRPRTTPVSEAPVRGRGRPRKTQPEVALLEVQP